MKETDLLNGKKILVVDDEPDVLESLEELLSMCEVEQASNFETARAYIEEDQFDLVILDIMGVSGYELLGLATQKEITTVMLTAHALTPEDIAKSHREGAAYFLPKEEMVNITSFLNEILEAKQKGLSTWDNWMNRLAGYCERTFGAKWQDTEKDFWDRFPFY
jgi:DNA-binding NtrC family response regulator